MRVSGDIIFGVAPSFQAALEKGVDAVERAAGPAGVLVVDLSDTEFMDSTGLGILLGSTEGLRKRGGEVRLVGLSRPVTRVLEVTGLMDMFRVYPDVLSATAKPAGAARDMEHNQSPSEGAKRSPDNTTAQ